MRSAAGYGAGGARSTADYPRSWRILPFLGPAFVACVAYIDPGNFATNIAGGSKFGYTLCWVILASNLMAMLIQTLSAKLASPRDATSRRSAGSSSRAAPRPGSGIQAELIAMATDLAEFLGAALGFHLLFGMDLFPAAVLTGLVTFAILGLQRLGFRTFEAVIAAFVAAIGICYLAELWFAHPPLGTVALHSVKPEFAGSESVLLAGRDPRRDGDAARDLPSLRTDPEPRRPAKRLRGAAPLPLHEGRRGDRNVDRRPDQHGDAGPWPRPSSTAPGSSMSPRSRRPQDARAAPRQAPRARSSHWRCSRPGSRSSTVGTLSGQVVMQGFIEPEDPDLRAPPGDDAAGARRGRDRLDPTRTLVISQVVLSFGIRSPSSRLVWFTSAGSSWPAREPEDDDGRRSARRRADPALNVVPAGADLRACVEETPWSAAGAGA
jgi:manganese transport protein